MHREVQPNRRTGGWADSPEKGGVYILSRPFYAAFLLEPRLCPSCWLPQASPDPSQRLVYAQNNTNTATWYSSSYHQKLPPRCTRGTKRGQRSELSVQQTATRVPRAENVFLQAQWFYPGGDFCLPRDTWQSLETPGVMTGGMYWHPVGRGQGCCFWFMFWCFGYEPCGILAVQPGTQPAPPALESKVLAIGPQMLLNIVQCTRQSSQQRIIWSPKVNSAKAEKTVVKRNEIKKIYSQPSVCVLTQSCPTLCDPIDCNPPGSSVNGISQARMLEWVTVSYSKGSSWPRDQTRVSCVSCIVRQILYHWAT